MERLVQETKALRLGSGLDWEADMGSLISADHLAKVAEQYLKKGAKVYIEGQLQTRKWQDQQGNDRYSTEVVLRGFNGTLTMLDGAPGGSGGGGGRGGGGGGDWNQGGASSGGGSQGGSSGGGSSMGDDLDDDIPF